MRDVAIVAAGMTRFGELWKTSLRELFVEAAAECMKNAGVETVDFIFVGNMAGGQFVGQEHLGPLCADNLGLAGVPAMRIESACASGGAALRAGFAEVASGMSDVVLVAGVEKMNDGGDVTAILASAADEETEAYYGITFPGLYAMIARAHMEKYGTTEEELAAIAVKNHEHGFLNPKAQFRRRIDLQEALNATPVADPLRLLNCSPVSDGGAAVLMVPLDQASKYTDQPIRIAGSGLATSTLALADREDITFLDSVNKSAERAYEMAKMSPTDIQLAEVHDCFGIAEICCTEALGLVERGQGGKAAAAGVTSLGGKIPVNTSGGLKSKGHPVGATGVAQAIEVFEQLRGEAGDRQVKDARVGLAQNMGGSGASSVVHIFEKV